MGDHLRSGVDFDLLINLPSRPSREGVDAPRFAGFREAMKTGIVLGESDGEVGCDARWPSANGLVNTGVGGRVYAYSSGLISMVEGVDDGGGDAFGLSC